MNKSDHEFRKNCQFYHTKISKLLKKGQIQEARDLMGKVQAAISQWEESLKSAKFKVNLLKNTYAGLIQIEKRASYKLDRRQQEKNDPE